MQVGKAGSQAKDAIGQAGSQAQDTAKQVQAEAKQIPGAADELAQTQLQAADQAGLEWHVLHRTFCEDLNCSMVKSGCVCGVHTPILQQAWPCRMLVAYFADQPGH